MKQKYWIITTVVLSISLVMGLVGIYLRNKEVEDLRVRVSSAEAQSNMWHNSYLELAVKDDNSSCEENDDDANSQEEPSHEEGVECDAGMCTIEVPLADYKSIGYSLSFPSDWSVRRAGAEDMNLLFNESVHNGSLQEIFLELTTSDLPFDEIYKSVYTYESTSEPLIPSTETVTSTLEMDMLGKRVLKVETDNNLVDRYFLAKSDDEYQTVYMFEISYGEGTYTALEEEGIIQNVEEMIAYMSFVR